MELRLLGPVQARVGGQEVALGPRMPRTLLAALAADAGRAVQPDTLVERLWGSRPPQRPQHAIHVYVSRVRAALGDGFVARRFGGYVLDVPRRSVDVLLFRELVALGELDAALDLPGGVPLEDLAGAWVDRTRLVWERWHRDAAIAWARREVAAGAARHAVDRLDDLCDRHPLAEPLWASLLVALDAAGRRAEALDRFAGTRRRLREELGTEPGAALQAVHRSLLTAR
jgi:DNA-binding SARP family transcriptional activator